MALNSNNAGNAAEIDRLALALAKEPGSKAFIPLAEEYGKAGMWEEAAAVLEDGLKTYPSFITAMVALGRAYDQMSQPVKAKAVLEEAVKLSPENLRAHRTLAKIYLAQGAKDAALRSCEVILAVNPQDQESLSIRTALGAPLIASSPASSSPPQTTKPDRSSTAASVGMTRTQTVAANETKAAPADQEEEIRPEHVAERQAAPLLQTASSPSSTSDRPRPATVKKLEEWLTSIQTRRRALSKESSAPTS